MSLVCKECRMIDPPCHHKDKILVNGNRYRVPKKNNDKAWKRIENGEMLWDRPATEQDQRQWVRKSDFDIEGNPICHRGHKVVQPNIYYIGSKDVRIPACASCHYARVHTAILAERPQVADEHYKEIMR